MSFPALHHFYSSNINITVWKLFHSLNRERKKKSLAWMLICFRWVYKYTVTHRLQDKRVWMYSNIIFININCIYTNRKKKSTRPLISMQQATQSNWMLLSNNASNIAFTSFIINFFNIYFLHFYDHHYHE